MIELDLVPFLTKSKPFSPETEALAEAVGRRIYFGSAPGLAVHPYIVVEGPTGSTEFQFCDAVCLRGITEIRIQVFAKSVTEVRVILDQVVAALSSLRDLFFQTSYVQAFFRGQLWVDNERLQRGKQERTPDGDETPLAKGHVDYSIWCSNRKSFMSGQTTKVYGADGGDKLVVAEDGTLLLESGAIIATTIGIGVVAGANTTVDERVGIMNRTIITLDAAEITMTDAGAAGNHGSRKLYDFPEGMIEIASVNVDLTTEAAANLSATAALVGSLGTSALSTDNATLLGAEANIVPSITGTLTDSEGTLTSTTRPTLATMLGINALTDSSVGTAGDTIAALPTLTDTPATADALRDDLNTNVWPVLRNWIASATAKVNAVLNTLLARQLFDGTGTAKDCYLNIAVPDAGSTGNSTVTVSGTVEILWINHGD